MHADIRIEYLTLNESIGSIDIEKIIQLDNEFFPTPWNRQSWINLFSETRLLAVLFVKNQIVGFALFNILVEDRFAHLLKIIVVPNARNGGLGKLLLREATSHLGLFHGIQHFFLEVDENNLPAISTYRAMGYEHIHTKKDFYGKNKSALIMTLAI